MRINSLLVQRIFMVCASISGATAVALGAYASHGLKPILTTASLEVVQTALIYQFIHTLALLLVSRIPVKNLVAALPGVFFIAGILFFSINLYAIQILHLTALSKLTPIGGIFFILGWLSLLIFVFAKSDAEKNTDY